MAEPLPDGYVDTGARASLSCSGSVQLTGWGYHVLGTGNYLGFNSWGGVPYVTEPVWKLYGISVGGTGVDCEGQPPETELGVLQFWLEGPFDASPLLLEEHEIT